MTLTNPSDLEALAESLERALVGRSIVSSDADGIDLDDGTRIQFRDYGDCCAWATVEDIVNHTNVISSVQVQASEDSDHDHIRVFALVAGDDQSDLFKVVGNEGTGYYTYGVEFLLQGETLYNLRYPFSNYED